MKVFPLLVFNVFFLFTKCGATSQDSLAGAIKKKDSNKIKKAYTIKVNLMPALNSIVREPFDNDLSMDYRMSDRHSWSVSLHYEKPMPIENTRYDVHLQNGLSGTIHEEEFLKLYGVRVMYKTHVWQQSRRNYYSGFFHSIYGQILSGKRLFIETFNGQPYKKYEGPEGISFGGGFAIGYTFDIKAWVVELQSGLGAAYVSEALQFNSSMFLSDFGNFILGLHPTYLSLNFGKRF